MSARAISWTTSRKPVDNMEDCPERVELAVESLDPHQRELDPLTARRPRHAAP
jgi:hypothetical protein